MRTIVLTAVAILACVSAAVAEDWPMGGRSSDRNPVSPERNAPTEWQVSSGGKKAKNVRWSAKLGSRSLGGPVVSGGLVWIGTNNQTDEKAPDFAVLACFRESDGKPLYRYLSPRRGSDLTHDWPLQALSGSPLAEGDKLWFCTNRREVVCLDVGPLRRGTGDPREVWKLDLVKDLKVHPRPVMFPGHDFLGSPAAYKDFLYVPTGNGTGVDGKPPAPDAPALVCLRKDTGKVVWSDNSPGRNALYGHSGSPLVIEVGGRAQVIHPQADGWVRSFDAETGKLVWKLDCNPVGITGDRGLGAGAGGKRVYVLATPVHAGGRVYFGTGVHAEAAGTDSGRLFCIDPTKTGDVSPEVDDGSGKGKKNPNSAVVWEFARDDPKDGFHFVQSSVAVHDGLAYAVDQFGIVHCIDAKSGQQHWWHDTKGGVFSSLLVADGKLYVGTGEGEVWIFGTGKTKYLVGRHDVDRPVTAPPVFANGVLYLLTDSYLHAVAGKPAVPGGVAPLERGPTDDHLNAFTKRFLVAMRKHHADKNANALREFFDPRYLKEHRLTDGDLRAQMAAVGNIRSYEIAADRRTILCFVETKEDPNAKELLKELILIRVALHEGKLFLVPPKAPDPKTGSFEPWLLRTKANP